MSTRKSLLGKNVICLALVLCSGWLLAASDGALPGGYSSVVLGMSVDAAKNALMEDPAYGYRGDRDVSLLPGDNRTLISTYGIHFFNECWFQFDNDRLYIITLNLNRERVDYYSVFKSLCDKYGQPDSLSPQKSEWRDGSVIMSLERPLTLKYTDEGIFQELQDTSNVNLTKEEENRRNFLESL
ncbi:MAG: hypothetical protein J6C11_06865 [Spirochaetaceae bacterium]|nr:hypothetical protein [Spirochaetaceae bacterium]